MGLSLSTTTFPEWINGRVPFAKWQRFTAQLEKKTGLPADKMKWRSTNLGYERIGSYTSYGVFVGYLQFLTEGDYGDTLDKDEDVELEALECFRKALQPKSLRIPFAKHFTRTGDCDTIFIPVEFDEPLEFVDAFVASLPRSVEAIDELAKKASFSLDADYEEENPNGKWNAISTAKNISRMIFRYFSRANKKKTCVEFA